jgi:hypothetical protein
MAGGGLPPPPTRADNGDFAWVAWYNQLYTLLSTTGSVAWTQINKAGSSIADLQNHNHGLLTSILGTGENHISDSEATTLTALNTSGHNALTGIQGNGNYHVSATQASNLNSGVSGTFKSADLLPKTITVTNGIITSIV